MVALLTCLRAAEPDRPAGLHLSQPLDYQVVQRRTRTEGMLVVAGKLPDPGALGGRVEAHLRGNGDPRSDVWQAVAEINPGAEEFRGELSSPAGGWFQLEVRIRRAGQVIAEAGVAHVGIGEVFAVAGQSNAANHGEEKQQPRSGRVATISERGWALANDPQPGATGTGGSFVPPFGDALAEHFNVPVGILAAGVGATSVREWLPRHTRFSNPPTLTHHVTALASGEWESDGALFERFTDRLRQLGPRGFRAVLWHQGESDANQQDPTRTLSGELYRRFLEQLIRDSRRAVGWEFPWFVAQVSYHTPDDSGSPDIRTAQQALWRAGVAREGPDSDALRGELRESGGRGVHFSGQGLREHAARWAEKVTPWLEEQLLNTSPKP